MVPLDLIKRKCGGKHDAYDHDVPMCNVPSLD